MAGEREYEVDEETEKEEERAYQFMAAGPGREMEGTNHTQQIKQEQPRFTVSSAQPSAQHGPSRTRCTYMDQDGVLRMNVCTEYVHTIQLGT